MNEMSRWAKGVDLARKFEAAIQTIDNGNGWEIFKGLDKGETLVKVVYDGQVRFLAVKPKKASKPRTKKAKPEMKDDPEAEPLAEPIFSYDGDPSQGTIECAHCGIGIMIFEGEEYPTECPNCNKPLGLVK